MPFKSEKQRRYLHANEPEIAQKWEEEEKMYTNKRTDRRNDVKSAYDSYQTKGQGGAKKPDPKKMSKGGKKTSTGSAVG